MPHSNEPSIENLLKLKDELVANLKINPNDKDLIDKMHALTGQISRRTSESNS